MYSREVRVLFVTFRSWRYFKQQTPQKLSYCQQSIIAIGAQTNRRAADSGVLFRLLGNTLGIVNKKNKQLETIA